MSLYLDPNQFTERLRNEWEQYGGLIIAVDVDSTLMAYWDYELKCDFESVRQLVRDCKKFGCTIVINTAAKHDRLGDIKKFLKHNNIPYDYFNESPPYIKDVGQGGKVYANVYLDDRAGLYQVYTTLQLLLNERKLIAASKEIDSLYSQVGG